MALHLFAPFTRIRSIVLLAAFAGLAACGGGGGDSAAPSSVTYTGKTTPAEITADNATSLTLSAYDTGSVGSNASPLGVQSQTQNQTAIADAASLTRIAKDIAQKAKSSTSTSAAGAWVEMGSFPGDCGGSVVFSYDDVTLDSSFAFNSYCDAASAMTFTGQLTMTMGDTATINVSMNLSIRENATGVVYRLQDYNAIITDVYDTTTEFPTLIGQRVSFSGTFYSPSEGYVAITTPTAFYYSATGTFPTEGVLVVTEVGSIPPSSTKLTVLSDGQYMIEVDLDGDGAFGGSGDPASTTGSW